MSETFATPDDLGDLKASELHSSLAESLGAQAGEAIMGGTRTLARASQYFGAEHGVDPLFAAGAADAGIAGMQIYDQAMREQAAEPDVPIAEARARVKSAGLDSQVNLPDQDTIRGPVLDLMLQDARERAQYAAAVNRGPQGFFPGALGFLTQVGAGMIDPVNAAAFSIPVLGEARYGQLLARAGDSLAARAALRTGVGAAQGAVGGAALAPADWWLRTQDGEDFTYADALKSVVLSAGMGAAFHGGGGVAGDLLARARGQPLAGTIEDMRARALAGDTHAAEIVEQLGNAGTHLPGAAIEPGGVDTDAVPGITAPENNAAATPAEARPAPNAPPLGEDLRARLGLVHPADVLADLPPSAQEDVVRASIAGVTSGEPVRAGEMLAEAAKDDPRIAESIEAWHGSPHDFDAFDSSKIGSGEGDNSEGWGIYLSGERTSGEAYRTAGTTLDYEPPGEGHLYRVKFAADRAHLLNWEKPLTEQSAHVRSALAPFLDAVIADGAKGSLTGEQIYEHLERAFGNAESASRALAAHGIPGLEYVEQGRHGEPISNYVVFDDKLIRITHKNGKEVGLDELKAARRPDDTSRLPAIDATHDVVSGANSSADPNGPVFVDKRIPQFSPTLKDGSGQPANLHKYLAIHETEERAGMARAIAAFKQEYGRDPSDADVTRIYDNVHSHIATPAERAAVEADGVDWNGYSQEIDGYLSHIEREKADNPPPGPLHVDPEAAIGHHRSENKQAPAADAGPALPGAPEAKTIARRAGGRGPRARDPQTWSLLEFLASRGGIDPADPMIGDVHALTGGRRKFVPGFGDLVRKGGMRLDRAREAAVEAGYLHDAGEATGGEAKSRVNDLLEAMDNDLRGNRVYRHDRIPEHVDAAARERLEDEDRHRAEEAHGALAAALKDVGDDVDKMPAARRARVIEIMRREGESDPLSALERAVMEEHYREAETGAVEPFADHVPGWDDADDGSAASRGSGAAAPGGDGEGGGDRGGSRAGGAADRSQERPAAGRADWQRLARKPEPDDELSDASREAAEAPAPPDTPAKAVSAAQAAAGEAEKLLADIMPGLSEAERKTFEDALADLKHDTEARETIVRDGAACLAAASAEAAA